MFSINQWRDFFNQFYLWDTTIETNVKNNDTGIARQLWNVSAICVSSKHWYNMFKLTIFVAYKMTCLLNHARLKSITHKQSADFVGICWPWIQRMQFMRDVRFQLHIFCVRLAMKLKRCTTLRHAAFWSAAGTLLCVADTTQHKCS